MDRRKLFAFFKHFARLLSLYAPLPVILRIHFIFSHFLVGVLLLKFHPQFYHFNSIFGGAQL